VCFIVGTVNEAIATALDDVQSAINFYNTTKLVLEIGYRNYTLNYKLATRTDLTLRTGHALALSETALYHCPKFRERCLGIFIDGPGLRLHEDCRAKSHNVVHFL